MADIRGKILDNYAIDIAQDNIFKLYKIDSCDISLQELEKKIQDTRKRWNSSVNGANEKNAERDRMRLEKAEKYEAILKNDNLRKQVFDFYEKSSRDNEGSGGTCGNDTEFAKEYFQLVATTKKIKRADVDFFFKYYQAERKNKKAILEMLSKEMKIKGIDKDEKYPDEDKNVDEEGKRKNESSPVITNLFQEITILKIRRAIEKYEEAKSNIELCKRYPTLREGLYEFLGIKDVTSAKEFTELMSSRGKEVYAVRQEKGTEYVPLVDLFNILRDIGDYQDVVDNIDEFKLLLKYPNLTPYMFAFVDMKPETVKSMVNVAKRDYSFRDDTDFLLTYYEPLHDNFGISNNGISAILKKAEKKAKQTEILNRIDEKIGRNKNKREIPIVAEVVHWLIYWPIFMVYFVFEIARLIFSKLQKLAIPVFAILFIFENIVLPKYGIDNMLILFKIFNKNKWIEYLRYSFGADIVNGTEAFIVSMLIMTLFFLIYVLPGLCLAILIYRFANDFNKRFDWVGIERTFKSILLVLKEKTETQYKKQKPIFFKRNTPKIIVNFVCLLLLITLFCGAPAGVAALGEISGYASEVSENTELVVTEDMVDIRLQPGDDNETITTVNQGSVLRLTGNKENTDDGAVWYEVYVDEDMKQTGWVNIALYQ